MLAVVVQVSLESSFQPTIQLYLLFPTLVQQVEGEKFVFSVRIRELLLTVFFLELDTKESRESQEMSFNGYHCVAGVYSVPGRHDTCDKA